MGGFSVHGSATGRGFTGCRPAELTPHRTAPRAQGLRVQGNLYIDDTAEDGGGFRVVPGFHKNFNKWIERFPPGENIDGGVVPRSIRSIGKA